MERTEQYIDSLLSTIRTSLPNFAKQTLSDALKDQATDTQATIAALQARVRELEARCQRAPLDHETVCHACDGSGWVERGY